MIVGYQRSSVRTKIVKYRRAAKNVRRRNAGPANHRERNSREAVDKGMAKIFRLIFRGQEACR